ncbi:hypothetical protein BCEP4_580023 [Burkholderia cepacia]|nr:hypothetical protein BCEP4_580023 [Burkholderia cepacia]
MRAFLLRARCTAACGLSHFFVTSECTRGKSRSMMETKRQYGRQDAGCVDHGEQVDGRH